MNLYLHKKKRIVHLHDVKFINHARALFRA